MQRQGTSARGQFRGSRSSQSMQPLDRKAQAYDHGRSGGAIGPVGLARFNRHKGRLVSRELNGLWSQLAAVAIDSRLRTRSAVPSRSVPSRPVPLRLVRFPFRVASAHP